MKNLVNFFFEIGTLRRLVRSYRMQLFQDVESVAEHSHRALIIAYVLAKKVGANAEHAMLMGALHDSAETRTGDSNWTQKQYLEQAEDRALDDQLKPLEDIGREIGAVLTEYKERKTLEAKVAKDADTLEYYLSLRELEITGNLEAKRRLESDAVFDRLYTQEAKDIMRTLVATHPTEWTWSITKETSKQYTVEQ